jgi:hypothetical protein
VDLARRKRLDQQDNGHDHLKVTSEVTVKPNIRSRCVLCVMRHHGWHRKHPDDGGKEPARTDGEAEFATDRLRRPTMSAGQRGSAPIHCAPTRGRSGPALWGQYRMAAWTDHDADGSGQDRRERA